MIDEGDVEKYAKLARISLKDKEAEGLKGDFESVLSYVSEIQKMESSDTIPSVGNLRNVMREDKEPHESGIYTDAMLAAAPETEDGFILVKKVL